MQNRFALLATEEEAHTDAPARPNGFEVLRSKQAAVRADAPHLACCCRQCPHSAHHTRPLARLRLSSHTGSSITSAVWVCATACWRAIHTRQTRVSRVPVCYRTPQQLALAQSQMPPAVLAQLALLAQQQRYPGAS